MAAHKLRDEPIRELYIDHRDREEIAYHVGTYKYPSRWQGIKLVLKRHNPLDDRRQQLKADFEAYKNGADFPTNHFDPFTNQPLDESFTYLRRMQSLEDLARLPRTIYGSWISDPSYRYHERARGADLSISLSITSEPEQTLTQTVQLAGYMRRQAAFNEQRSLMLYAEFLRLEGSPNHAQAAEQLHPGLVKNFPNLAPHELKEQAKPIGLTNP